MPSKKKNSKKKNNHKVYRLNEFYFYQLWRSLPSLLKGKDKDELKRVGFEDDLFIELLQIKNKSEFAKRFNLSLSTLKSWDEKIKAEDLIFKSLYDWAKPLTPNVVLALYRTAVKSGRASEVMMWLKLIEGWREELKIDMDKPLRIEYVIIKEDEEEKSK